MKKIGVMCSGGDAPGMNAAIRAVVRYAKYYEMDVLGVYRGYTGLIAGDMAEMDMRSVSDIIQRGGTILKTSRCEEFLTKAGQKKALDNIKKRKIEGLVVIGGDGSFRGAEVLSNMGIPTIGIPGTIDNDLAYTDFTLGFDTACNTALDAINKIRDTMTSHDRISIIEVMGRRCGDLALYAGIAGGAEIIIVPEHAVDIDAIVARLRQSQKAGKQSGIIILAEGAGKADEMTGIISEKSGMSVRSMVLGHIQRGGNPSMFDRLLGTRCGVHAVELLQKGVGNRAVGIRDNKIFDMNISEALSMTKKFDEALYKTARIISR